VTQDPGFKGARSGRRRWCEAYARTGLNLQPYVLKSFRSGERNVRGALRGSDARGISRRRLAFHERVDRLSVNKAKPTLGPFL
jgi:hypothetical protein